MRWTVKDAELIIEAVPENLELKKEIFRELGEKASAGAILATNSSSIPVSRLESSSGHPEYCLNIHFYFPMQSTNIVDIMGGTRTLPEPRIPHPRLLESLPLISEDRKVGGREGSVPLPRSQRQGAFLFLLFQEAV